MHTGVFNLYLELSEGIFSDDALVFEEAIRSITARWKATEVTSLKENEENNFDPLRI